MENNNKLQACSVFRTRELIAENQMSIKQFAELVGISPNILYGLDVEDLSISTLRKISSYFNVSIDYLVGFSDIRSKVESKKTSGAIRQLEDRIILNQFTDRQILKLIDMVDLIYRYHNEKQEV